MRIHAIIHAEFEKLGAIQDWISKHQHHLTTTHTYRGQTLPDVSHFDMLIVMGGPQSPLQLDKYPYLRDEINLVKAAISADKVVFGVCLGAQIIGEALGANTEHSPNKEIGVYPIELTEEAKTDPLFQQFPPIFDVMHWHNDMPGIPKNSRLLAKSAGCPRQAFAYGDKVYGFQFHMEMNEELMRGMVDHCANDLTTSQYVQSAQTLLGLNLNAINQKMHQVLDYLATQINKS